MNRVKFLRKAALRLFALMLCLAATVPQLWAQTYTVAGSDAQALGTTWDPGNTSNNMTLYSGNMYYLLKTVTYSSNTNGEYKITVNNNWTVSYGANGGSDNVSYSVNSGTGYVCFAFNSSSHVPHMVSSLQNVIVTGSDTQALGVSWGHTNTSNKMSTTDGITYTLVRNVDYTAATNNLQCKVCINGSDYYGTSTGGNVYYNIPSAGSYTVTYNFNAVTGIVTVDAQSATPVIPDYYITGDNGLGLGGFKFNPTTTLTYDSDNDVYTYSYNVTSAGTFYFAFADGPGSDWNDFNNNHRIGPTSGNETVNLNGGWATTQMGGGSYAVTVDAGLVTITLDATHMRYKVDGTAPVISVDYYVVGSDTNIFPNGWTANSATQMSETSTNNYSWTASNVHLTAGTNYDYKVTDGSGGW